VPLNACEYDITTVAEDRRDLLDCLRLPLWAGYVEAIEGAAPERMKARGGFFALLHVAGEKQYRRGKTAFG
jgi:hypothetical protein